MHLLFDLAAPGAELVQTTLDFSAIIQDRTEALAADLRPMPSAAMLRGF